MPDKEAIANDFDKPWKVALEIYLQPFLELCFPVVHDLVDWRHPPAFLDTELSSLTPEPIQGPLAVDKLVKVRLRDGSIEWLFIHVEVQAQRQTRFALRMWIYYYRIRDKFGEHVVSLAVLADNDPTWFPNRYEAAIAGCELRFQFPTFKVMALRNPEEVFARTGNPFALVIAAHQMAQATTRDPEARFVRRGQLLRNFLNLGMDGRQARELWRIIQMLTRLPRDLELRFRTEATMVASMSINEILTPLEEILLEERETKGQLQASRLAILDALEARFGSPPHDVIVALEKITDVEQLRAFLRSAVTDATLEQFLTRLLN